MTTPSYDSATPISAKSLAIDLLSTMPPRHPVPVGALVRAAVILGVGENSMRVALARLRARGLVRSDERGLYRLGPGAQPVNLHVRSWRDIEERVASWDGSWLGLECARGAGSRQAGLAQRLLGFRPLTRGLGLRPNNLEGGVDAVRHRLQSLGSDTNAAGLVFRLDELDDESEQRARGLWDTETLESGYRETRERLLESEARMKGLSREAAMSESFRLGGAALRQIVLDPLLPAPIVDVEARRQLVSAMRHYDRVGRRYWKDWAGEVVELEQSPAAIGGWVANPNTLSAPAMAGQRRREG